MSGRSYDDELLKPLVARVMAGESISKVARESGIYRGTIAKALDGQRPPLQPKTPLPPNATAADVARRHLPTIPIPTSQTVLAISDLHCPFEHPDALAFLNEVRRVKQTTLAVCLGDEIDAHAASQYPKDPDGMTLGQEIKAAIDHLIPFYRDFPEVLVCESNHTIRPWKLARAAGLSEAFLRDVETTLKAPDRWRWASRWEIDGVLYIHGDNGKSGERAHVHYMRQAKCPVVIGHIHSYAGVNYEGNHFAVNAGCLIDDRAYAFKYAKNMLLRVNLGCAVIYEGKYAEFVPMRTDADGRWVGYL